MSVPGQPQQLPAAIVDGTTVHIQPEPAAVPVPVAEPTQQIQQRTITMATRTPPANNNTHVQRYLNKHNDPPIEPVKIADVNVPPPPPAPPQLRYAATGGITLPGGMIVMPPPALPINQQAAAQAQAQEEVWQCHKCKRDNLVTKTRCGSCQSWRGGKREGFKKRNAELLLMMLPQEQWTCPCGSINKPNKVRCSKCQKWKNGKRMNKDAMIANWYAQQQQKQQHDAKSGHNNTPQEPWDCDKCGNTNEPTKVRCGNCPRWKNGKRLKFNSSKKSSYTTSIPNTMQMMHHPSPPPTAAAVAAAVGNHTITAEHLKTMDVGSWFCVGCNHLNTSKKQRCGSCQRWKYGKRENMQKKNRARPPPINNTHAVSQAYMILPSDVAATDLGRHVTELYPKDGQGPPIAALAPLDPLDRQHNWVCACGQANLPSKTRCTSCQKWKGGVRGNLPRKSPAKRVGTTTIDTNSTTITGMPPPAAMVMPNQPNTPWKCAGCGHDNGFRKLRCETCQSWKNGKKQLSQRAESGAEAPSIAVMEKARQQQVLAAADGALWSQYWKCHGCKAHVPGTKNRCSSCKCWKGGVRHNLGKGKLVPQPWVCNSCKKQNDGSRVRCTACQGWRFLRRLEDQALDENWICDRCQKPNKATKVRCGGCQRWRGGQRPDMKKSARAQRSASVPNVYQQQNQLRTQDQAMKTHPPPIQMPYPMLITTGPGAAQPPPYVPDHAAPAQNQTQTEALQHTARVQDVQGAQAPETNAAAKADATGENRIWTCTKCTCDNPATEMKCKICDEPKNAWA